MLPPFTLGLSLLLSVGSVSVKLELVSSSLPMRKHTLGWGCGAPQQTHTTCKHRATLDIHAMVSALFRRASRHLLCAGAWSFSVSPPALYRYTEIFCPACCSSYFQSRLSLSSTFLSLLCLSFLTLVSSPLPFLTSSVALFATRRSSSVQPPRSPPWSRLDY